MSNIDQREQFDEYLYELKTEINNLKISKDKLSNQIINLENENNLLKDQIRDLDEHLFIIKPEFNNLKFLNEKLNNQIIILENENIILKDQNKKLINENTTLEDNIRKKQIIASVIHDSYNYIINKLEKI